MEGFIALANLGGLGLFSALVYFELRAFRQAAEVFSKKIVYVRVERAQTEPGDPYVP